MIQTIEINDSKNEILTVELMDILNAIGPTGINYNWAVMYLYAIGSVSNFSSMKSFEEAIAVSTVGYLVSWRELNDIAKKLTQTHDILIAGNLDAPITEKLASDESLYKNFDIVLDLFDSSYWRIHAKDQQILNNIYGRFNDVRVIE